MRILIAVLATLVAAPSGIASQAPAPPPVAPGPPRFEVVSIKPASDGSIGFQWTPGRFAGPAIPMAGLLNMAWGMPLKIEGGPPWLLTSRWNITATWDAARVVTVDERAPMLRAMLEDYFKIVLRREARETPVYALVMARDDGRLWPSLRPAEVPCDAPGRPRFSPGLPPSGQRPACGLIVSVPDAAIIGGNAPLERLTRALGSLLQRDVVDRTGLTGEFDVVLTFARDSVARPLTVPGAPPAEPDPGGPPSIFTAVQEQLGLKLESTRAPMDYYIVERAELPDINQ